jgi:hypothetical protein
VSATVDAATYYVSPAGSDANPGTLEQPFLTLKQPCTTVLAAGDEIIMRGGDYPVNGAVGCATNGASWDLPIVIRPYPRETVRFVRAPGSTGASYNTGGKFVPKFTRLIGEYIPAADGISPGTRTMVFDRVGISGYGEDFWLENVEIKNNATDGIFGGGDRRLLINLHVHHNGGDDPKRHGIYSQMSDSLIEGGWWHDGGGYDIHLYNMPWVNGCIKGERKTPTVNGCGIVNNTIRNVRISNNGLIMNSGADNQVYNNIFFMASSLAKIHTANSLVANNTLYRTSMEIGAGCNGCYIANNFVWTPGGATPISVHADAVGVIQTNNYKLKVPTAPGPLVVDAEGQDFRLAESSLLIDGGTVIEEVTDDYAGTPRPQGLGSDIGAYEHVPPEL